MESSQFEHSFSRSSPARSLSETGGVPHQTAQISSICDQFLLHSEQTVSENRSSTRRLRVEDALTYLQMVKRQCHESPSIYFEFLEVMKDYKCRTIGTLEVILRVSRLFKSSPSLITDFNSFLPAGYEVNASDLQVSVKEPSGVIHTIKTEGYENILGEAVDRTSSDDGIRNLSCEKTFEEKPTEIVGAEQQRKGFRKRRALRKEDDANESSHSPVDASDLDLNYALAFIKKVKTKFLHDPHVYSQFLGILQAYWNYQEGATSECSVLNESQVRESVANLFIGEPDLIKEFTCCPSGISGVVDPSSNAQGSSAAATAKQSAGVFGGESNASSKPFAPIYDTIGFEPCTKESPPKKMRVSNNGAFPAASDMNTMAGDSIDICLFLDKARFVLNGECFNNFLRLFILRTENVITKAELVELASPFISRHPDMILSLNDLLSSIDQRSGATLNAVNTNANFSAQRGSDTFIYKKDFSTGKRLGVSYRAMPPSYAKAKCSGRTALCDEVLNNSWVSFPSWSSEDTSRVHSKKSIFEEYMHRVEDERFELDIVLEVNKSAIEALECIQRRINRMRKEDLAKFKLDSSSFTTSPTVMLRALRRPYGDKAEKIFENTLSNPSTFVPRLLLRLRGKGQEWRDQQTSFNRLWREQTEKYYWKSLDHQALTFKANDLKHLRSKMIIHQYETMHNERAALAESNGLLGTGPHSIHFYSPDSSILNDVNDLIIHYVKRQTNVQTREKRFIKRCLRRILPDLFDTVPQELSDDENIEQRETLGKVGIESGSRSMRLSCASKDDGRLIEKRISYDSDAKLQTDTVGSFGVSAVEIKSGTTYRLIYGGNPWCVFIRLHHILCDRLANLKQYNEELILKHGLEGDEEEEIKSLEQANMDRNSQPIEMSEHISPTPRRFYSVTLREIKNLLDGQIESASFEDSIRSMFGTRAYIAFTMDKLVIAISRQLQQLAIDELQTIHPTFDLYYKHRPERPCFMYHQSAELKKMEAIYERTARQVFVDQKFYKIYFLHKCRCISIEVVCADDSKECLEKTKNDDCRWIRYAQEYVKQWTADNFNSNEQELLVKRLSVKPIFLMRNARLGIERQRRDEELTKKGDAVPSMIRDAGNLPKSFPSMENLFIKFDESGISRLRSAAGTSNVLIRAEARARGCLKHKASVARRKERFSTWLEEKFCTEETDVVTSRNWLFDGSKIISVRHPEYNYLTYNRYITSSENIGDIQSIVDNSHPKL